MALISVGIDHEHASLDFLERATVAEHEWSKVLRTLVSHRNIHEAVFVSTCLRTEVVAVIDRFHGALEEITLTLSDATGLVPSEFQDVLTVHFDRGVANHLFAVAAGLKSVVPGEFEVLGQLRRALELAVEEQSAGAELDELFHRALATGRRVRSETAISMAFETLGDELCGAEVVVVGAGQLASGVVKSLLAAPTRVGRLTLVNRTPSRAEALAIDVNDERFSVQPLERVDTYLATARLAIVAVEVPAPLISRQQLERCSQPLLVVDLGVPRAVAHDLDDLANIRRVDIGDLRDQVERALGDRHEALEQARELVAIDVEKYLSDQRARGAASIVKDLRERFDEIVDTEMTRRERELATLSDQERELLRSIVQSVVAKIAHRPTVTLKEAAGTDQGVRLSEATRSLFDL